MSVIWEVLVSLAKHKDLKEGKIADLTQSDTGKTVASLA